MAFTASSNQSSSTSVLLYVLEYLPSLSPCGIDSVSLGIDLFVQVRLHKPWYFQFFYLEYDKCQSDFAYLHHYHCCCHHHHCHYRKLIHCFLYMDVCVPCCCLHSVRDVLCSNTFCGKLKFSVLWLSILHCHQNWLCSVRDVLCSRACCRT